MSKAPDKELVPDTPSGTAEQFVDQTDSTVGESLLQHFLHDPNLSPTLNKTEDSHTNSKDSATQSSSDSSNSSKSHPSQISQLDQQAGTREGARELGEGNAMRGVAGTGRKQRTTSQEGRASESDPAEGPGGSGQVEEGFLGAQTQAQSLDTSWDKRRRLSDNRMRAKTVEEEENLFANREQSVEEGRESVDQSVGVIENDSRNDEELDQLESSEAEVGGGGSNNRESQKENASSSRPPVPSTFSAPLALRNSHVNLEPSASAPSSSPAVAQQLLQRSPRKKAFAPIPETASSTDPTPSLGHLFTRRHIPQPETNSSPDKGDISDLTFSGPGTSTPAFALAHAPAPAPTQAETRSIPPFRVVEKRPSEPSANPSPVRSHSLRQSNTTPALPPDPALFASSAALAKPAPKRKKTREEWDGISQDTPEELRLKKKGKKDEVEVEAEESVPLSPTQIHEDEKEDLDVSMDVEERDPTPKPTAERTVDMDIDEGDSHSYSVAVEDHGGGTLDTSTVNGDDSYQRRSLSPRPTASEDPLNESLSDQGPPRNQVTLPLFAPVASSSSASSSPMTSQDHHVRLDSSAQEHEAKSKRLSDISEMRSSQELPPTQYEVEATQKVYDVEKSQLSIGSVDMDITNSATWHAPFAHDESTSTSHSRQRSNPVPGRELRRVPPPPTPAVDPNPPRASSPLKQSFQLEESTQPADESSPAPNLPQTSSSNQPQPTSEDSLALPVPPLHHANPATQPVQPTQEVAESSPDIPLSKRARLQKGASEATSRSSLRRPTPSPSRQQQTTQSSNGKVVPDSEGPTQQDHEEEEEEDRRPVASTSARIDESDSEGELESLTSLEDIIKASKRKSQARSEQNEEEIEKPKKDRKGKGKAKEQEEDGGAKRKEKLKQMRDRVFEGEEDEKEEEEVSAREEKKSKGKGKAKVAAKEKGGGSKGKGKGKKKVVEVESESELSSPGEAEETNYSDMPKARNSKKLSPKKKAKAVVVVDNSSAKKPRRKASGPTIVERSDDEEMEEEEEERQSRPAKPATSKRKRQPSPPNAGASSTSKRSKRSLPTGAGTSSKKVVSKGRRSTTGSSRATVAPDSPEPDQPVAGPSRLRFDLAPEDDARTETSDTKPSIGSKLPPSAPFSRCFGLWRDDGYYYSGTIESVSRENFNVKFDDGNTGKLRSNEIRRCELEKGDYVLYFPDDSETETQALSYIGEFRVSKIDRNEREDGEDEGEEGRPLEARDVAIVKEAANFGDDSSQSQRFLVEAIRISPLRSHQFNNRKLTPDEIDAFEGKVRSNAKPLPVIPPPTRPDISAFEDNDKKNWGLFGRIAFLVTYASSKSPSEPNVKELKPVDRERFLDKLKDNGATIIDWEHLFESGIDKQTKKPQVSFPPTDFNGIDTILLLADRPTTTMKFLIALALGIPCCSLEFAGASIKAGTRLDWRDWLLPSGYIQSMKTAGIGGQLRALLKSSYDLSSLERSQQGEGVFKNQSFLVIMEKQGKSREEKLSFNRHAYMLLSLLSCCSSSRIDFLPLPLPSSSPFVQSPSEFLISAQSYTHVFLDFDQSNSTMEGAVKGLLNGHKGIVNMNWIKQCLMAGRLLPSERIKLQD